MTALTLMLLAWSIEVGIGWPSGLFKRIRHPVVWIGALISYLDQNLNRSAFDSKTRYALGAISSLLVVGLTTTIAIMISHILPPTWWGWLVEGMIASSLLASRSLYAHVQAVAEPLQRQDLEQARQAVSQIVGRDPDQMGPPAVSRASLESLAENMSDGVVAPLFWGALFGLPGIAAYKAVNTLDSMIGHRTETHGAFGGFAARLDDVANFVPARLTGLALALASGKRHSLQVMFRDAAKHRSPNAGWPEAAMAGGLGVRLSGPRTYGTHVSHEPWLNADQPDPDPDDLQRGLDLYVRALGLCAGCLALIALGSRYV